MVLLHANGGDRRDFGLIVPRLAELGWRVTTLDWPGHGRSPRSHGETAVGFAEQLPETLDRLGESHVLLGNSVGGFAALHAAARRPDLVAGLVLVSPGGFSPRSPVTTLACRIIGARPVAPHAYRLLPKLYLRGRSVGVTDAIARARTASESAANTEVYGSVWRSFADPDHDARRLATEVRCPTLLAWGTRDPILPWLIDGGRARRALPHADVITFDGAGHQPFIERPDEFLAGVTPFLGRLRTQATA
jgi:pimeloyl-ACP methyl ester carboxylesterase